jgi:hypothetical protein
MIPRVPLRQALADPALLGNTLNGDSWRPWRTLLIAAMGEALNADEFMTFQAVTGRKELPSSRVDEMFIVAGRRAGKDRAASVLASYLAALVDWSPVLAKGERGLVLCIGPDQRQAKITRDYIEAVFNASPILSRLVVNRTADAIELENRISIEVRAASFRRLRGITAVTVIATEAAFWYSDETSANADTEILNAVRPSLATTHGQLIVISSPYGKRGEVWNAYRRHYGPDGDPLILVAQGASRDFNPTLSERIVQRALERDYAAAQAEYLGQFRSDLETFVSYEVVESAVDPGLFERPPLPGMHYFAFIDPSGGSSDSMAMAIAHREGDNAIIDLLREVIPPFKPENVCRDFAADLKRYRCMSPRVDRYGAEWVRTAFKRHGIEALPASKPKADLYGDLLPPLNSGLVSLLDNHRAIAQIASLERRTSRAGKDSIDHPPGGRDDIANVIAGAVHLVLARPKQYEPRVGLGLPIVSGGSRAINLNDEFPQSLATYNWLRSQQR